MLGHPAIAKTENSHNSVLNYAHSSKSIEPGSRRSTKMDESAHGTGDKRSLIGKSLAPLTIVVLLSLATWSYFYWKQMALTPAETSVIVGFWLLVVFVVRWIFAQIARSDGNTTDGKDS